MIEGCFTRIEDGNAVLIEHVALPESPKGYRTLFNIFIKITNLEDEKFLKLKEALILAVEYNDSACYVGSRFVDGWYELYFYAKDSKGLNTTASDILKESGYAYESGVVKDPKWNFYYKSLEPTPLELIDLQSKQIIAMLENEGDNVEESREVEHYLFFSTPSQKERFVKELETNEVFSFLDEIENDSFENGIAVVANHNVTFNEVQKVTHTLYDLVSKEHGFYEGWSTTLCCED